MDCLTLATPTRSLFPLTTPWIAALGLASSGAAAVAPPQGQGPDCSAADLQCVVDYFPLGDAQFDELVTFEDGLPSSVAVNNGIHSNAVVADFTGDGRPDVLAAVAGQPLLIEAPNVLNNVIDLPLPAGAGSIRGVAIQNSSGLPIMRGMGSNDIVVWTIHPDGTVTAMTGAELPENVGGLPISEWADPTFLDTADVDDDGTEELIGYFEYADPVGEDVAALRIGEWGQGGTILTVGSIEFTTKITSLVTVDWRPEIPGKEIAVTTGTQLVIVDSTLTAQDVAFLDHDAVLAAPLSDALGQGVAVVVGDEWAPGKRADYVQVVRPGAGAGAPAIVEALVDPGVFNLTSVAVGSALVGSSADLVLAGEAIHVLRNESASGGPTFGTTLYDDYADALATSLPLALPPAAYWTLTADIDLDGDRDVLAGNDGMVSIDRNATVLESLQAVMLESDEEARDWTDGPTEPPSPTRTLTVELRALWQLQRRGADKVEAQLFLQKPLEAPYFYSYDVVQEDLAGVTNDVMTLTMEYDPTGETHVARLLVRGIQTSGDGITRYLPDITIQVELERPPGLNDNDRGNARLRPVTIPPIFNDDRVTRPDGDS